MNDRLNFPEGFLWGTATAAHQVEGNNKTSDWWFWEKSKKSIPNSGQACDQYHLFKEDFQLIRNVLHNNAHRLSIEWARIEPEEGKFNKKETQHYTNVLRELNNLGIKPLVTLHHFTNPLWFSKKGGWEKRGNVFYFKRYVYYCAKEFGDLVDSWVIINEPNIYVAMSYLKGVWPPEKKDPLSAITVFLNLARAHRKAYEIIHEIKPSSFVGSAINMIFFESRSFLGKWISNLATTITNYSFILLTRGANDYIGVNQYFFHPINWREIPIIKKIRRKDFTDFIYGKGSDLGWTIYPQGIYHVCKNTWNKFHLPIIITENGVADKKDIKRTRFIIDNLTWLHQAINEGVDIRGYFHWTLLDNIEWGLGKKVRFGLFKTDYKTLERIPRKSAYVYGQICKSSRLPE